jgi:hypothetical protein
MLMQRLFSQKEPSGQVTLRSHPTGSIRVAWKPSSKPGKSPLSKGTETMIITSNTRSPNVLGNPNRVLAILLFSV